MEYVIGTVLALAEQRARPLWDDRERVFYPSMMITIAACYILSAAIGASAAVVILESVAAIAFMLMLFAVARFAGASGALRAHDAPRSRRDGPISMAKCYALAHSYAPAQRHWRPQPQAFVDPAFRQPHLQPDPEHSAQRQLFAFFSFMMVLLKGLLVIRIQSSAAKVLRIERSS